MIPEILLSGVLMAALPMSPVLPKAGAPVAASVSKAQDATPAVETVASECNAPSAAGTSTTATSKFDLISAHLQATGSGPFSLGRLNSAAASEPGGEAQASAAGASKRCKS